MNAIDELTQLKRKMEQCREERAQAEGRLDSLMDQLKDEFECSTIEEARAKAEQLSAEIASMEIALAQGVASLRKEMA